MSKSKLIRLDASRVNDFVNAASRCGFDIDITNRGRVGAGMGRCHGGFCGPKVIEILARELGCPAEAICKNDPGSEMVTGKNRS